jgi:tellurite resistance protein TerC
MQSAIAKREAPGVPGGARPTGVLRAARKIVVAVVGTAVLIAGVALIVLPGPAFLVIPAGLAILATEFPWARRLLRYAKERALRAYHSARRTGPGGRTVQGHEGAPLERPRSPAGEGS